MRYYIKIVLISMICLLINTGGTAQNYDVQGLGFNFQGTITDENGIPLVTQGVPLKFTLIDAISGSLLYEEERTITTDAFGIVIWQIGSYDYFTYTALKAIDFSNPEMDVYLKVELKSSKTDNWIEISNESLLPAPYAKVAANGLPVGSIMPFAGNKNALPKGWLVCDGSKIDSVDYPGLYAVISHNWGGAGTSFKLPDLRGAFLRGVDGGVNEDPDKASRYALYTGGKTGANTTGTYQNDATGKVNTFKLDLSGGHQHGFDYLNTNNQWRTSITTTGYRYLISGTPVLSETIDNGTVPSVHTHTINGGGDKESRPNNAAVYYIIKY